MHRDLEQLESFETLRTDVCVIGAGAAGICLARRLLGKGHQVILLESGGLDHEARSAALNEGECRGEDYYELANARLRFFGGTTAIWGGRCAELDPIDFERRDYVPHSGWPLRARGIRSYYGEARAQLGLSRDVPDARAMSKAGVPIPAFDPELLRTPVWQFDGQFDRFTFQASKDVIEHPKCRVLTHATMVSLDAAPFGRHIESATVKSLTGQAIKVRARIFVLAAGGIENPRLLLASRSVMNCGIGNARDQVGRYFMEHPHARGGKILDGAVWQLLKAFGRRHRIDGQDVATLIAPSENLQRREGILNTSLTIVGRQPEHARQALAMRAYSGAKHKMAPTKAGRRLWMMTKKVAGRAQQHIDPLRPWLLHQAGQVEVALLVRAEQAPNPDSRVTLGDRVDALGVPRVALDWKLSELDARSVGCLVGTLRGELARLGLGRVEPAPWLSDPSRRWVFDPLVSSHPIAGYHHMGTTRMSDSEATGVTDGSGRVHGVENLYVAGSSLFPTSGWANPTLTAIALALRTADKIAERQSAGERAPMVQAIGMRPAPRNFPAGAVAPEMPARAAYGGLVRALAGGMIAVGAIATTVAPLVLLIECVEWLTSSEWPGLTVADGLSLFGIERELPETDSQRLIDMALAVPLTIALFLTGVFMLLAGVNLADRSAQRDVGARCE